MTKEETINAIFDTLRPDQEQADLFGIVGDDEDDDEEYDIDAETECPHCGHPLKW